MGMTAEHGVIPILLPLCVSSSQGAFADSSSESLGAGGGTDPPRKLEQENDCPLLADSASYLKRGRS